MEEDFRVATFPPTTPPQNGRDRSKERLIFDQGQTSISKAELTSRNEGFEVHPQIATIVAGLQLGTLKVEYTVTYPLILSLHTFLILST